MKPNARKIDAALLLLQTLTLAIWLESLWTARWVYPECDYPLFGWPLPYRAFSEVSSLEWFVDWPNYFLDLVIYAALAAPAAWIIRRFFQRFRKSYAAAVMVLSGVTAMMLGLSAGLNHAIDITKLYPQGHLRMTGMARGGSGSYGSCSIG